MKADDATVKTALKIWLKLAAHLPIARLELVLEFLKPAENNR